MQTSAGTAAVKGLHARSRGEEQRGKSMILPALRELRGSARWSFLSCGILTFATECCEPQVFRHLDPRHTLDDPVRRDLESAKKAYSPTRVLMGSRVLRLPVASSISRP